MSTKQKDFSRSAERARETAQHKVATDGELSATTADGDSLELRQRIRQFLATRGIHGLDNVRIDVDRGTVVLSGRIVSKHDRWLCNTCACRVAGVLRVVDRLEIPEQANTPSTGSVVDRANAMDRKQATARERAR